MKGECKIIKCCPKCGGAIEVSHLYQYSYNQIVGKRGKLLKKVKKYNCGSLEYSIANCTNAECDVNWGVGDFIIDDNDRFVDYKYCDLEEYQCRSTYVSAARRLKSPQKPKQQGML